MLPWQDDVRQALNELDEARGEPIVYERERAQLPLTATKGNTLTKAFDEFRPVDNVTECSWLFDASRFLATFGEPERGDIITSTTASGGSQAWQVTPLDGDKHFRFSDAGQSRLRVFCRLVSRDA